MRRKEPKCGWDEDGDWLEDWFWAGVFYLFIIVSFLSYHDYIIHQ